MNKTKVLWACRECGHSQNKWSGSCPSCQNWNTFVEEVAVEAAPEGEAVEEKKEEEEK